MTFKIIAIFLLILLELNPTLSLISKIYTVLNQKELINVNKNQYVRMSSPLNQKQNFKNMAQILENGEEILMKINKKGSLQINGPKLIIIFSQVNVKEEKPALGHSFDYMVGQTKRYTCEIGYAGQYCLLRIQRGSKILGNRIRISQLKSVIYFESPIKLNFIPEQIQAKVCWDSLLQNCQQKVDSFIKKSPFYLVLEKKQKIQENFIRREDSFVEWSKIQVVKESLGPAFVFQSSQEGSQKFIKGIFSLFIILCALIYPFLKYFRYLPKSKDKKAIPAQILQLQPKNLCFNS